MSINEIADAVGVSLRTTKRWLHHLRSEGEMVSRNVGRRRGAEGWCVSLVFAIASHISRIARGVLLSC